MSWYDRDLVTAMPFVEEASELREIPQAGNKLFAGLAAALHAAANDPAKVAALAVMIDGNRDLLTGAILSRTSAAHLLDPACMPPGSVPAGAPAEPVAATVTDSEPAPAGDDEYEYDDSDEDEDDVPDKPAKKKKKK